MVNQINHRYLYFGPIIGHTKCNSDLCNELDEYIKGGADSQHKQLREGYGHIPKPRARKIRNYLYGILEDAWRYEREQRPGRKKRS